MESKNKNQGRSKQKLSQLKRTSNNKRHGSPTGEKVLCCIRTANSDMVLTSDRLIVQSLPFSINLAHFVASILTLGLPPQEAIFGESRYSAWEEGVGSFGGGSLGPPKDPRKIIDPKRIIHSISYDEITEVRIERREYSSSITGRIYTKKMSLPFGFGGERFNPFWHFLSPLLKDKIIFPGKEEMSKLKYVWLSDFSKYLNNLGFQAVVELKKGSIYSNYLGFQAVVGLDNGLIRLKHRNFDFIIKDEFLDKCSLVFTIEGVPGGNRLFVEGVTLEKGQKGEGITVFEWKAFKFWDLDKRLAQILDSDSTLIQTLNSNSTLIEKLVSWRKTENIDIKIFNWGKDCIHVEDKSLESLPPREYFEAMDKIAHYIRSM